MRATDKQLKLLAPYLVGEQPGLRTGDGREDGGEYEWDMHCPLHEDNKRSAQLNVTKGVWFCQSGCGGGTVKDLIEAKDDWVAPPAAGANGERRQKSKSTEPTEEISDSKVHGWASALLANEHALEEMITVRGIHSKTIKRFEIGWDNGRNAYTIPVRNRDGQLANIRRYQIRPPKGRRKIWGVEGANEPRLYPAPILKDNPDSIIICEGELDALITIQYGFPAITRTGAARVWRAEWNAQFKDKTVYLCHDCDEAGQDGNRKVGLALRKVAKEIKIIRLPYPIEEKHGKDLTDFWMERDGDVSAFQRLIDEAQPFDSDGESEEPERLDPSDASVMDALDSRKVGKPLRLTVTIKGKREPGYSVPRKVRYRCTRDAGQKCNFCPLFASGDDEKVIAGGDPLILEMMESTKPQIQKLVRGMAGIPECPKLKMDVTEHQAIEVLFARPSVEHMNGAGGEGDAYKNLKLTSVGRHDTNPNNTVSVTGALYPDPRKQLNEFLVWDLTRMASSLDRFQIDGDTVEMMKAFQPRPRQAPLKKLREIADDLAAHVTFIYGRHQMHAAMDLVFHSVLSFNFAGKRIQRGWLDFLVIGDTRTGKSEAATRLSQFYRAGEIISCEAATFAGVIGGVQQFGSNKEWAVTWGAVPINDRRLVVLDEASGLEPEDIAAMSSVRSSGMAELTKIRQERTYARTRLIWLANPRNAKMSDYTYGVQAIKPLIGNPEDIARFDLAMSVQAGEVPSEEINRSRRESRQKYPAEAAANLLRWVWSRQPEQIIWTRGAEEHVFDAANRMGKRYVEDPPLIQAANVREKIARVAVAIAARLFSTDETHERIMVKDEHVRAAVEFIDSLYNMTGFGYAERSREIIGDRKEARRRKRGIKKYLADKPGLAKFLRSAGKFRRQDLEEIMNVDREFANAIINTLWEARMVRKVKGDIWVEPTLHDLLREVR